MTRIQSIIHRAKYVLSAIAALCTTVSALDLSGITHLLPPDVATVVAVGTSTLAFIAHSAAAINKSLDEFKTLPIWIFAATCLIAFPSCSGFSGSLTSPYGEINTDKHGNIIVRPLPIVIPIDQSKGGHPYIQPGPGPLPPVLGDPPRVIPAK